LPWFSPPQVSKSGSGNTDFFLLSIFLLEDSVLRFSTGPFLFFFYTGGDGTFVVGRNAPSGHAVSYFLPKDEDSDGARLKLWTTRKANDGRTNWNKKPKAVRDNRGQIIPGEYE
jgi:hypothetical protein